MYSHIHRSMRSERKKAMMSNQAIKILKKKLGELSPDSKPVTLEAPWPVGFEELADICDTLDCMDRSYTLIPIGEGRFVAVCNDYPPPLPVH